MRQDESLLSHFLIFLRFGFMAWGGPVAQIAMVREELVARRQWITPEKFNHVLAIYQALPGPEAHELCVYFGMVRHGRLGAFLAGLGFMLPGFVLMLALSWAYVEYGAAALLPLFVGIAPAVAALVVRALHNIGSHTLTQPSLWVAGIVSVVLTLLQVNFFVIFLICAAFQALWSKGRTYFAIGLLAVGCALSLSFRIALPEVPLSEYSAGLFIEGLKAGLLSFGGAYTAIPFLQDSMIGTYPAITPQSFLDGIALSSIIPAPLVIFGTYLGYLAEGMTGAVLVTLGIFIPAFLFTMLGHSYLERIVENKALHGFLDGIAAAVTGLLAVTAFNICLLVLTGWQQATIFAVGLALLYTIKNKWITPAVITGCGLIGFTLSL